MYHEAIDEPYSFLHINIMQKYRQRMLMQHLQIIVNSKLKLITI